MSKITFLGAGSTVFAKNVLGDTMLTPALQGYELALFDINHERLGFVDLFYFSKKFKKWYGSSPSKYRDDLLSKKRFDCMQ